ncbi:ATP-binding protein [Shewanella sp. CG12_big_fil_rev_8_21_14_0_65_47_15]|uniref:AAA family ATPase n=1 Tax=Shewanella sp. CG12_big_fil_rev_8_21_14_0_65_47_15 TaxID=1975537 RepID=UPI000CBAD4C9|nr:ATP-binding protein [Shewanella sp. CG12_big_fil_rev_8_21_14_0_65_47_15]PIW60206.1 MAG: ATP-binding protein [Shewanella sp. CG12_big_fil_rev_8_21_14_0_65_47_15]
MLQRMTIKNLTVFAEANLSFAPGLNVIIGENGCGKSHLLKTAYSLIAASAEEGRKPNATTPTKSLLQKVYAEKLVNVLRPESLGRLARRRQGRERCELSLEFDNPNLNFTLDFSTSSKSEVQISALNSDWQPKAPVFLPTRELLTLYPGFVSIYDNHYLEFDETYRDACLLLGAPALKGPRESKAAILLKPLEDSMGGKVILDSNGRFYLSSPGQGKMEMPLVAEGLRKLSMLARLIGTGSLLDKGYLFWDEPESNLNPKLTKLIAEMVLHLCANGIQVFIATHSLFLLRELEVLSENKQFKKIKQRYFSLRPNENGVEVEQADAIEEIQTLVLLDEELSQSQRFMEAGA